MQILVINPGSITTKIAVYHDETPLFTKTLAHSRAELSQFADVIEQRDFRRNLILDQLRTNDFEPRFDAVIARGSLAKAVESGVFEVNAKMTEDACTAFDKHACDLGCVIAREIADMNPGTLCLTADPGSVDEMNDYAHITGSPMLPKHCIWHALNQRAIARRYAREHGTTYEQLNLLICHMGGGISIAAHDHGRAVDVNNALNGDGPFSPERAGTLPAGQLIDLCFSGRYSREELQQRVAGRAGMSAHLGINDLREALKRIDEGDDHARLIVNAMIYHTAKHIAALSAVLRGKVDAILLTGGMAHSDYMVSRLKEYLSWLAPIAVYPGENEMLALAQNALAVLNGEISPKTYE